MLTAEALAYVRAMTRGSLAVSTVARWMREGDPHARAAIDWMAARC